VALAWQPSLLDAATPDFDRRFAGTERRELGSGAWLEVVPGWVDGVAALFQAVLDEAPWAEHHRPMYDRMVLEPRLTTRAWPDPPPVVRAMAASLGERYQRDLDVVSANLYRDGRDSVAWHGDRVGRQREDTVVAILSLGSPRRFLLRPAPSRPVDGGTDAGTSAGASGTASGSARGRSPSRTVRLTPAAGDLLVLGGTVQRTWQHSVPKVARAGPRISIMFREQYDE
jgi:alkylated DNA repair dioxygenase AlkB